MQDLEIIKIMQETRGDMDFFYSHLSRALEKVCKKCYFFRLMSEKEDVEIDVVFNRDYFTHNYGDDEFYFEIVGGDTIFFNKNIDWSLDRFIKEKNKEEHFDTFMELFSLECEDILEDTPSSARDDIRECLFFVAKWVYVNGFYKNPDNESIVWRFYEWDIVSIEDQIREIEEV